jgi:hypothetical protein
MMIEKNRQIERLQDQVRQLERSVKRHAARTVQRRQMERRPRRIK